jgi:bleomycin hydrolase
MKKIFFTMLAYVSYISISAQPASTRAEPITLQTVQQNAATPVKNQGMSGTCWCFSTTSLVESQCLKKGIANIDLSEMFSVRNIYLEKAKNYLLRQGNAQFGEGGLGHDLIRAIDTYGAIPENIFRGMNAKQKMPNHMGLDVFLKKYLDTVLKQRPIASNWLDGYNKILDSVIGVPPTNFEVDGKSYTPQSYAKDLLQFSASDYVSITSFTHHPFYKPFILEAPDNFANGSFYNLPVDEMIDVVKTAVTSGYTVMWDADVSNGDFAQGKGFAMLFKEGKAPKIVNADEEERMYDATIRQNLYENLTTQDDHLMHITGIDKTEKGKEFFKVKNSWGEVGPYKGYIDVSIPYFAINTVSLVVPKAALSKAIKKKLGIQ